MTNEEKLKKFANLMDRMRTEWFVFDCGWPNNITNINQIRTLCNQILLLEYNQDDCDNTNLEINFQE